VCRFHAHREPQAFGSKQDHVELACFGWLHLNPPDGYLHSKGGLTESVRLASASTGSLSRWLSNALDVALCYAPYLREAADRGLMGEASAWPGLAEIAARPGKSATLTKAGELLRVFR
jgi:hypothetical protein